MKFSCHVDINEFRARVVELFDDPNNLDKWQDGYKGYEHISGEHLEPGAKYRIYYEKFELIETLMIRNLPLEISGFYEHKHMDNTMVNRFIELPNGYTRYEAEIEYTRISHPFMKLMSWIAPGMFKKQVMKWMVQFKEFVETV